MAGTSPTISTNNTSFNVGDTLSITITFGTSRLGTLYIGDNSISIPQQKTPSYTYDYVLTTSGNYSVYFQDYNVLDSNIINITVTGSSNSSSVFLTTITKVKTALENVFVKKSDVKDNLTSTDTDKPLSSNQGKVLDSNKEDKSNKSSSITTDTGSTTKYPTVKAVEDYAQPIGNYLTSHQDLSNYVQKSQTSGLIKNDGTIDTSIYLDIDDSGDIFDAIKEIDLKIPSASSTTPSADTTSGSIGTGTTWAKADHTHPKSTLYAEASHTHNNYLTSSDFDTITATVNYTDNTSETVTFYIVPSNNNG